MKKSVVSKFIPDFYVPKVGHRVDYSNVLKKTSLVAFLIKDRAHSGQAR